MSILQINGLRRVAVAVVALGVLFTVAPMASPASAAPEGGALYHGVAYGSWSRSGEPSMPAKVTNSISASVMLACNTRPGAHAENHAAQVDGRDAFRTGSVQTTADAIQQGSTRISKLTSTVKNVNVFDGTVTAQQVAAVSMTKLLGSGQVAFDTTGSKLTGIRVEGQTITGTVQPNTRIQIPDLGTLILFQVVRRQGGDYASQTVNMIHLWVTEPNDRGIPVGTEVIIGSAKSSLYERLGPLAGRAYSTELRGFGGTVSSGPSYNQPLPCQGTDGEILRNQGNGSLLGPVRSGSVENTAMGIVTRTKAEGTTTSTVKDLNLLAGFITAEKVHARAHVLRYAHRKAFDSQGSRFASLVIDGEEIEARPDKNTVIEIPGVARITLYKEEKTDRYIQTTMLEVKVLTDQALAPAGSTIIVGVARVSSPGTIG